jgi:dTDP-4-amino-4,6-dideoxygalactose transaminase
LQEQGIATGIRSIHLQESYNGLDYARGQFPLSEQLADRGVPLPTFAELNPGDIERVSQTILACVR